MVSGENELQRAHIEEGDHGLTDQFELWVYVDNDVQIAHGEEKALELLHKLVDILLMDRLLLASGGVDLFNWFQDHLFDGLATVLSVVKPEFGILRKRFDYHIHKPLSGDMHQDTIALMTTSAILDWGLQDYDEFVSRNIILSRERRVGELGLNKPHAALETDIKILQERIDVKLANLNDEELKLKFSETN